MYACLCIFLCVCVCVGKDLLLICSNDAHCITVLPSFWGLLYFRLSSHQRVMSANTAKIDVLRFCLWKLHKAVCQTSIVMNVFIRFVIFRCCRMVILSAVQRVSEIRFLCVLLLAFLYEAPSIVVIMQALSFAFKMPCDVNVKLSELNYILLCSVHFGAGCIC